MIMLHLPVLPFELPVWADDTAGVVYTIPGALWNGAADDRDALPAGDVGEHRQRGGRAAAGLDVLRVQGEALVRVRAVPDLLRQLGKKESVRRPIDRLAADPRKWRTDMAEGRHREEDEEGAAVGGAFDGPAGVGDVPLLVRGHRQLAQRDVELETTEMGAAPPVKTADGKWGAGGESRIVTLETGGGGDSTAGGTLAAMAAAAAAEESRVGLRRGREWEERRWRRREEGKKGVAADKRPSPLLLIS